MPPEGKRIKGSAAERAQARERLRAELLAAARSIATESAGFDAVTVRSVAGRVGYRAPVVYEYFANKRALLEGLVELGFAELASCLSAAGEMLLPVATAYWEFAVANPHLYRLMHTLPDLAFGTPAAPSAARSCFAVLQAAAVRSAPNHPATRVDPDAATDLLWAHLHGLTSLTLDGRIKGGAPRARELLTDLTTSFTGGRAPDEAYFFQ